LAVIIIIVIITITGIIASFSLVFMKYDVSILDFCSVNRGQFRIKGVLIFPFTRTVPSPLIPYQAKALLFSENSTGAWNLYLLRFRIHGSLAT
jgi:hypothetical protein